MSENTKRISERNWQAFLSLALLLGIVLRLSFPNDIEYKTDEKYMFDATQKIGVTEPWPAMGMDSGAGLKNPGMSVWLFVALTRITHASTPPDLARAVQLLNILGLFLLAFFSLRILPETERAAWRWATAFAAVNPFAVLLQRKIWAQSTLPFFCILFWIAWHYRQKRTGAFFWGFLALCLGQIHMAGFFLASGVFIWTALYDRRAEWKFWLLGSLVGAVPMVPWLQFTLSNPGKGISAMQWFNILHPHYWKFWITDSLGMGLSYSLKTDLFRQFLTYPLIGGKATYLVGVMHFVIILTGILILFSTIKTGAFIRAIRDSTETGFILKSVMLASGLLMTLSCVEIRRHYLLMSFPLEWVWLARMGLCDLRWGKRYLTVIWIGQLLITIAFLGYIHANHGAPNADYGIAYQFQSQ